MTAFLFELGTSRITKPQSILFLVNAVVFSFVLNLVNGLLTFPFYTQIHLILTINNNMFRDIRVWFLILNFYNTYTFVILIENSITIIE